jgi:hypothetical protein
MNTDSADVFLVLPLVLKPAANSLLTPGKTVGRPSDAAQMEYGGI